MALRGNTAIDDKKMSSLMDDISSRHAPGYEKKGKRKIQDELKTKRTKKVSKQRVPQGESERILTKGIGGRKDGSKNESSDRGLCLGGGRAVGGTGETALSGGGKQKWENNIVEIRLSFKGGEGAPQG